MSHELPNRWWLEVAGDDDRPGIDVHVGELFPTQSSMRTDEIVQVLGAGYDVRRITAAFRDLIDELTLDVLCSRWRRARLAPAEASAP